MPSSFTNLNYHLALATEGRRPVIRPPWREELCRYVGGIIRRHGGVLYEIAARPEHIHVLASLKAEPSLAETVGTIKASSSRWIDRRAQSREGFAWEDEYRAFSVGENRLEAARRYVRGQEERHQKMTFRQEMDAISRKQAALLGRAGDLLLYHLVFSTKYRLPVIHPNWKSELYRTLSEIVRRQRGEVLEINGMAEHVHLFTGFRAEPSVASMMRSLKCNSSKWINDNRLTNERFAWQTGYAAFTVSVSQIRAVRRYIQRQEEHHAHVSFDDEMSSLVGPRRSQGREPLEPRAPEKPAALSRRQRVARGVSPWNREPRKNRQRSADDSE